jgi:hypothetical protein
MVPGGHRLVGGGGDTRCWRGRKGPGQHPALTRQAGRKARGGDALAVHPGERGKFYKDRPASRALLSGFSQTDHSLDQVGAESRAGREKQKEFAQGYSALAVKHDRHAKKDNAYGEKSQGIFIHFLHPPDCCSILGEGFVHVKRARQEGQIDIFTVCIYNACSMQILKNMDPS